MSECPKSSRDVFTSKIKVAGKEIIIKSQVVYSSGIRQGFFIAINSKGYFIPEMSRSKAENKAYVKWLGKGNLRRNKTMARKSNPKQLKINTIVKTLNSDQNYIVDYVNKIVYELVKNEKCYICKFKQVENIFNEDGSRI